jgi:hypothetical protein
VFRYVEVRTSETYQEDFFGTPGLLVYQVGPAAPSSISLATKHTYS